MSFNISLSGLNAAQKDLDVTGNNIANASTIGFKQSRAEFADVFSKSVFSNTKTQVGSGVNTAAVSQQFSQGALQSTGNSLDLAIKGDGFFVLSPDTSSLERSYTRAGAFRVNDEGFVTNALGDYLQVYDVDQTGTPKTVSVNSTKALQIPTEAGQPTATDTITESLNLPASAIALDPANFDPLQSTTYNSSTSVVVYDSLGESHTVTQYFLKDSNAANNTLGLPTNVWRVFNYVDEIPVDVQNGFQAVNGSNLTPLATTLIFDSSGNIDTSTHKYTYTSPTNDSIYSTSGLSYLSSTDATNQLKSYFGYDSTPIPSAASPFNPDSSNGGYTDNFTGNVYDPNDPTNIIGYTHELTFGTTQPVITEPLGSTTLSQSPSYFDSAGAFQNNVDGTQTLTFNFKDITQYATGFQVSSSQNGSTVGQLTNVSIGDDGVIAATYSNGSTTKLGMVALAKFSNPQGLTQIGDTSWKESQDSGEAVPGVPGNGTFGNINSSALESSNTDLSSELVDLISAQRNYQANSRALEVNSTLQDTILQIR